MRGAESVDCVNTQATGAKPMSSSAFRQSTAASTPQSGRSRTSAPPRHAKMYRLGRQINALSKLPTTIFTGAAHHCAPPAKLPTVRP